jgi:hypothetical protein
LEPAVKRSVGTLVEIQPPYATGTVVGEEVVSGVLGREQDGRGVIECATGHGAPGRFGAAVPAGMARVLLEGIGLGALVARPAVVGAVHYLVDLLSGLLAVVDKEPTRGGLNGEAVGVAQAQRPDGLFFPSPFVRVERVVLRDSLARVVGV